MNAQILHIHERKQASILVSSPEDFTVIEGESISPQIVLDNPDVSLYCLDDANQRALFCELPPGIDLSQPPFYYQEQFEQAQRLIAVPCPLLADLPGTLCRVLPCRYSLYLLTLQRSEIQTEGNSDRALESLRPSGGPGAKCTRGL